MKHQSANGKYGTAKKDNGYRVDYHEDEEDYRENRKKRLDLSRRQSRQDKYRDKD
ncbi:hypothetical protein [Emcibacter sp.]|uniref:hypothetical protein n=1 Tax=Emcibacter sp. TaxID=1979954 RepID=UPI003A9437D4